MNRTSFLLGNLLCLALVSSLESAPLEQHARRFKAELTEKVLPYWHDTTLDPVHGGYLLADAASGRGEAREKQLVTQSRMVWGFSHAHLKGLSSPARNYSRAAETGYRFLLDHFKDREHGGYYWRTDLAGQVTGDRKILYGESFVIYALVEYHRATGDGEPLRQAMELFQVIQTKAHDAKNGGWIEHFTRDWQPILKHDAQVQVEVGGLKSANTHLHLMEALTELYEVTRDAAVAKALREAVEINRKYFYPRKAGESCFHRHLDWRAVTDPASAGLSYGHNVEFAWLMIRAQEVVGVRLAWTHFEAHLDHALKYGYDWVRGGLYNRGEKNVPALNTDKVWWAEAELIAALTDALRHKFDASYAAALEKQLHFLEMHQIVPRDGIWLDTVKADGSPKSGGKAHNWKANYHDVRALVKFVDLYAP